MGNSGTNRRFVFIIRGFIKDSTGPIAGPHVQTYLLAKELISRGWEVSYLSLDNSGRPLKREVVEGIDVYHLSSNKLPWLSDFINRRALMEIVKDIKPDVIYTRGRSILPWIVSRLVGNGPGITIWNAARDRDFNRFKYVRVKASEGNIFLRAFKYLLYSLSHVFLFEKGIKKTDICLCQTKGQRDMFDSLFPGKNCHFLPSAVEIPDEIPDKSESCRILWVGGIKKEKRPEMFMKLAEALKDKEILFDCIGDPLDNKLTDILRGYERKDEKFNYHGRVNYDEVKSFFQRTHILINTSIGEGFPNTFLQAWANGAPVVSIKADPDDLLSKSGLGLLTDSFEEMVRGVRELCEDREKCEDIGRNARRYVIENHSGKAVVDRLEKLIELHGKK